MKHKIALIGFGTVAQGLLEILIVKNSFLRNEGIEFEIVAVSDALKGSVYNPNGLEIEMLLKVVRETGKLLAYPDSPGIIKGWDSLTTIKETNANTVVEVTYTNVQTGQPAIDYCRTAFESGKNVVTSNKGPVALEYPSLSALAEEHGVYWGIEGSVMSGTPSLRMPMVSLIGNEIREIRGIFNGTTNYILTQMENGSSYDDALADAQQLGYAEADPTNDVEGYDALYKILILANTLMNVQLHSEQVTRRGITGITSGQIEEAKIKGKKWKLISRITLSDDGVIASVGPEMIPLTDPLAGVSGPTNAITYECDLMGPVTLMGAGAGRIETGFSLLIDLIHIVRAQAGRNLDQKASLFR